MPYANKADKRAYAAKHYAQNKEAYKRRASEYTRQQRKRLRRFILDYLSAHPCVDCGESDVIVLEFDHRDPRDKSFEVTLAVRQGLAISTVAAEIEKCDVRCANCHRRRTAKQREAGEFEQVADDDLPLFEFLTAG